MSPLTGAGAPISELDGTGRMLAQALGRAVRDHPVPDVWQPGAAADDAAPAPSQALARALESIGWTSLAEEDAEPSVVALGAVELGRGLAPLHCIDVFLAGSPVVAGLVRHGRSGGPSVELLPGDGLRELELVSVAPVAYGDASGVVSVLEARPGKVVPGDLAARRLLVWRAATIGYLAGLAGSAFEDCLAHVRSRAAFGSTLEALESVQARLADAATALEGLRLLAEHDHSWPALSHGAAVAVEVTAACHQLTGALGYTLEYPLQRRSRRARAMGSWAEWSAEVATGGGSA